MSPSLPHKLRLYGVPAQHYQHASGDCCPGGGRGDLLAGSVGTQFAPIERGRPMPPHMILPAPLDRTCHPISFRRRAPITGNSPAPNSMNVDGSGEIVVISRLAKGIPNPQVSSHAPLSVPDRNSV